MLYLASSVLNGFGKEQQLGGWLHTQCIHWIISDSCVFFLCVSVLSSHTVASSLPSVLYAITSLSLFEEALSVC